MFSGLDIPLKRYPTPNEVVVRLRDKGRRFVPRRFRVAVPARVAADAERRPLVSRRQAPLMFPGAAYDVGQRRSGLRGRVLRNGEPMRWAWIDAFYLVNVGDDANPNFLRSGRIGRAISDDRGEFLLAEFRDRLMAASDRLAVLSDFPEKDAEAETEYTWGDTGKIVFNNWLGLVYQITGTERSEPFMDGIDPLDPLGLNRAEHEQQD